MSSDRPIWRRPRAQLLALTGLVWLVIGVVLAFAWPVLLPFVLAGLAAYVIEPLIARLARLRFGPVVMPRWGAVVLVYLVLGAATYFTAVAVVPQVYREAVRGLVQARDFLAGITPERIDAWARTIDGFLLAWGIPVDVAPGADRPGTRLSVDLAAGIADGLRGLSENLRGRLGDVVALSRDLLAGTIHTLFFFLLLFMLTAFISMDAPRIVGWVSSLVPGAWRADMDRLLHGIDQGLAGVVRGQITIMLVNGALTLAGLLLLDLPFAFALAFLATITYVVPIFGTIISSVPIVLVAFTSGGTTLALLALGWIAVIHALEAYLLNPKIMGDAARIHPVLIVLALVLGERSGGIVGALLAVPVASVLVAIFRFLHRKLGALDEKAQADAVAARPLPGPGDRAPLPAAAAADERTSPP
jgi:predicted PurR-regulated permease PerM